MNGALQRSHDRKIGVDFFRLVGFIAVVALHAKPPGNIFFETVTRFAVPYFFLVAGYFLANRPLDPRATFARQAPRLLTVYFIWLVFYTILHIALFAGSPFKAYFRFLVTGGPAFHLWFIPALLAWVTAFAWAARRMKVLPMLALVAVLYAIGLFFQEFRFKGLAYWICTSGPFFAGIFIAAGYYINLFNVRVSSAWALAIAAAGMGLQFAERLLLLSTGRIDTTIAIDYYFGTLPFAVGVFLFALNIGSKSAILNYLSHLGRFTLGFYVIHVTFIWLLSLWIKPQNAIETAMVVVTVVVLSIASTLSLLRLGVNARYLGG